MKVSAYLELCKPRVVALMLQSALVGMFLAVPQGLPNLTTLVAGLTGIGLAACAGAVVNHLVDRNFDTLMHRTSKRPLPQGHIPPKHALCFAAILAAVSMLILATYVNWLTLWFSLGAMLGYAVIYTFFLKHMTPQNIVIGGLSGALPPLLGWIAVTGHLSPEPWLLVLIIFSWTPPHFWALAIYRHTDYAKADIPMLPVTHGIAFTKLCTLLYTILMILCTYLPHLIGMTGGVYLLGITAFNAYFLYWVIRLKRTDQPAIALRTFWHSITYLMLVFIVLLVDHYVPLALY